MKDIKKLQRIQDNIYKILVDSKLSNKNYGKLDIAYNKVWEIIKDLSSQILNKGSQDG